VDGTGEFWMTEQQQTFSSNFLLQLDATFLANDLRMPVVEFVGIHHHEKSFPTALTVITFLSQRLPSLLRMMILPPLLNSRMNMPGFYCSRFSRAGLTYKPIIVKAGIDIKTCSYTLEMNHSPNMLPN
jgi:hypothetical protein